MCIRVISHCLPVQLQDELDRCHNLLKHNLNKLVNEVRQELKTYWNRCYVSQEQRAKFTVHFTGIFVAVIVRVCVCVW